MAFYSVLSALKALKWDTLSQERETENRENELCRLREVRPLQEKRGLGWIRPTKERKDLIFHAEGNS